MNILPLEQALPALNELFTQDQQDALGEMGNICMGTAATTLNAMLDKQVTITTPSLSLHTWQSLSDAHPRPLVVVDVEYTKGVNGRNMLLLKDYDVALIANKLMGIEDAIDPDAVVLDEISMSAICEVMNQMIGSSATALASMLHRVINISTPEAKYVLIDDKQLQALLPEDNRLLKISFRMDIEDTLNSEIMQIIPVCFAQELSTELLTYLKPRKNAGEQLREQAMELIVDIQTPKELSRRLSEVEPGAVLPLDEEATIAIPVRVDGVLVAWGALVQLADGGYGVRIAECVPAGLDDMMKQL